MSINAEMKPYIIQNKIKIRSQSGAESTSWNCGRPIHVVIKKTNDLLNTQSARYNESTHTGLTRCKYIKAYTNRLLEIETGSIYEILSVANDGRITNLLLKKVETDV